MGALIPAAAAAWRRLGARERAVFWLAWAWLLGWELREAAVTYDDVWIALRYAANVAAGRGYAFNPGESVEGASSPAWVFGLAALGRLGVPLLPAAKLAGGLLVAAMPWFALGLAAELGGGGSAVLGPVLVALWPPLAFWGVNGLETGAHAALVLLAAALAAGDVKRGGGWPRCGPVLALLVWMRPEGVLFAVAPVLALSWRAIRTGRGRATAALAAGCALASAAGLTAWRLGSFGVPLPNTYYAKAANPALWDRGSGWGYLAEFAAAWGGPGWLLAAALGVLAAPSALGVQLAGAVAAQAVFAAAVPRDWMLGWRYLVPAWAPLALLGGAGLGAAWGALRAGPLASPRRARAAAALAGAAFLLPVVRDAAALDRVLRPGGAGDPEAHAALGAWLKASFPPGTRVALADLGAVGWTSGMPVIDLLGLTDRYVATHRPEESAREVLERRRPEVIVLDQKTRSPAPGIVTFASIFAVDRAIAASPAFARGWLRGPVFAYSGAYDLAVYVRRDVRPATPAVLMRE